MTIYSWSFKNPNVLLPLVLLLKGLETLKNKLINKQTIFDLGYSTGQSNLKFCIYNR
jgi:hypothetical protein